MGEEGKKEGCRERREEGGMREDGRESRGGEGTVMFQNILLPLAPCTCKMHKIQTQHRATTKNNNQ